jgi:uncharacterized membrane protein (DUF373 family)
MKQLWPGERVTHGFEKVVMSAVQLLLMILIAIAVMDLAYLLWRGVSTMLWTIDSVGDLQKALQRGFAGALLVMIGLELLETARAYLLDRHIRLEVIVVVAVIALGRHIIQLDLEHLQGATLLGIAALILALMIGYYLIRQLNTARRRAGAVPDSAIPKSDPTPEEAQP